VAKQPVRARRTTKTTAPIQRKFDALPDTVDFRDKMYVPTLVEVRPQSELERYLAAKIPVLDQGREGACTGFALATVVNYLLRTGNGHVQTSEASPRMLYVMAKRYDEWPGEDYEGSSARGAMKGWHKHGACSRSIWPDSRVGPDLTGEQADDAQRRPLGAYFRVNHKDIVGMHSAITEAGTLFATARVHQGWMDVAPGDREIRYSPTQLGGHAFAIVGYDYDGFWIQNSWGAQWGWNGLARLGYDDWLENGSDVWVARLGAPIRLGRELAEARMRASAPKSYESYVYSALRPHVLTAGNDGELLETGSYGLTPAGLKDILRVQLRDRVKDWKTKRVMLYAHGGLVSQDSALQYVANYREDTLRSEIYPFAFIWKSDAWTTIENILKDALSKRKSEGILDAAKDFMLDRLDDTLEPIARLLGGQALWDEMKENATLCATRAKGAARMAATHLVEAVKAGEVDEIHLVGHSAGAILLAPLAEFFAANKVKVSSLSLWAPACTFALFEQTYAPLLKSGAIEAFDLYTLDDATERDDDCANIYHKSLLYMVSHALEVKPRIPFFDENGTALLGLARDVDRSIESAFWDSDHRWLLAPGSAQSGARHHGDFDNDSETLRSTLERITGKHKAPLDVPALATKAVLLRQTVDTALRKA